MREEGLVDKTDDAGPSWSQNLAGLGGSGGRGNEQTWTTCSQPNAPDLGPKGFGWKRKGRGGEERKDRVFG